MYIINLNLYNLLKFIKSQKQFKINNRNHKMMNNEIPSPRPRPMKFTTLGLQQFVFKNSGNLTQSRNFQQSPIRGGFALKQQQSNYDRYNVNNLLLNQIKSNHIQVLNKNVVLVQQDLHPQRLGSQTMNKTMNKAMISNRYGKTMKEIPINMQTMNNFIQTGISTNNQIKSQKKIPSKTSHGFFPQQTSKEYSQNQLLFNFKQLAEQKKTKKKEFLQSMEQKLNIIQQQTKELQNCQFQEELQLKQIQRIHNQIGKQLTGNAWTGKINAKLHQAIEHNRQQQQIQQNDQWKTLHPDMGPVEINHVLNHHFNQTNKLLDQVYRVKSKSKQRSNQGTSSGWNLSPSKVKQFAKTGNSFKQFNQTSGNKKSPTRKREINKQIISATMKYPPKYKK